MPVRIGRSPARAALAPVVALLLAAAPLAAAWPEDCFNLPDQADMDACVGRDFKATDARLNALYAQIQQRLKGDPATAKLLTAAQRAWVGFRDAECDFAASGTAGGTINPMVTTLCRAGLTQKRIEDFNAYLHCKDGDTACPVPGK